MKKIATLTVASVLAGVGIAAAVPASAHTTNLSWGCSGGKTTFIANTWHGSDEGEPTNLVVDGVSHPFDYWTNTPPALTDANSYLIYDDFDSSYAAFVVSLDLASGTHTVYTIGGSVVEWDVSPITITTPSCGGVTTLAQFGTLAASLSTKPSVSSAILRLANSYTGTSPRSIAVYVKLINRLIASNTGPGKAFTPTDAATITTAGLGLLASVTQI